MSCCKSYYSLKTFLLTRHKLEDGVVRITAVHPISWPTGQFRVTQMELFSPMTRAVPWSMS